MTRPVALFDLDGTLADFIGGMQKELDKMRGPGEPVWDIESELQDNEPEYITARRRCVKNGVGFWRNLLKYKPGFDILDTCMKLNFKINIFSKAPKKQLSAFTEKAEWCEKYMPCSYDISLVQDKSLHYGKVLVDDWPPYIGPWLEHRPRGLVIMPAHKYNESFARPQIIRYDRTNLNKVREALKEVNSVVDSKI